jgi:thiamine-monophosphate kinase
MIPALRAHHRTFNPTQIMKLSEIGEFGFIERFSKHFKGLVGNNITGIGDDCAIIPLNEHNDQVVTTDLLIEDIHFIKSKISAFDLGYKSLAVNLSDIAAMGANPTASFLSIALPPAMEVEFMDDFMEGYRNLSSKYNVPLLGGDTTKSSEKLVINVCAMGQIPKGKSHKRSHAKVDDVVCVTGPLGDSAAGLKFLMHDVADSDSYSSHLIQWHNRPEPAIKIGLWLAQQEGIRAMMDISDGIASDLKHMLNSSNVNATIELNKIPLSMALQKACSSHNWDALELALSGGEDYHLLLTVEKSKFDEIAVRFSGKFATPLFPIGQITAGSESKINWLRNGEQETFKKGGFNHFND